MILPILPGPIVTLRSYNGVWPGSRAGLGWYRQTFVMDMIAATELLATRSTTLTSVGWISYIIIGALAGWIASSQRPALRGSRRFQGSSPEVVQRSAAIGQKIA